MVKEISNSCVILRYLQLFEDNKKFIEIGGIQLDIGLIRNIPSKTYPIRKLKLI